MAGANYMGGKRNAVKARTKDVTSRTRKDHFGKQRLNLLAQGFASQNTSHAIQLPTEIEFVHAQRDLRARGISVQSVPKETADTSRTSSCTPFSACKSRPSKIIAALERLEPISYGSKKDRLLKISDFAGILPREVKPFAHQKFSYSHTTVQKRKFKSLDTSTEKKRRLSTTCVAREQISRNYQAPSLSSPASSVHSRLPGSSDFSSVFSFEESLKCLPSPTQTNDDCSITLGRYDSDDGVTKAPRVLHQYSPPFGNFGQHSYFSPGLRTRQTTQMPVDSQKTLKDHGPDGYSISRNWSLSGGYPVQDLEMSAEWLAMAGHLQLDIIHEPQSTIDNLKGCPHIHERMGVDFHLFPLLRLPGDQEYYSASDTLQLREDHSQECFSPRTPENTQRAMSKQNQSRAFGPFIFPQQRYSSSPPSPHSPTHTSSSFFCAPLPCMEVLDYDTQSEGQKSPIHPPSIVAQANTLDVSPNLGLTEPPESSPCTPKSDPYITTSLMPIDVFLKPSRHAPTEPIEFEPKPSTPTIGDPCVDDDDKDVAEEAVSSPCPSALHPVMYELLAPMIRHASITPSDIIEMARTDASSPRDVSQPFMMRDLGQDFPPCTDARSPEVCNHVEIEAQAKCMSGEPVETNPRNIQVEHTSTRLSPAASTCAVGSETLGSVPDFATQSPCREDEAEQLMLDVSVVPTEDTHSEELVWCRDICSVGVGPENLVAGPLLFEGVSDDGDED